MYLLSQPPAATFHHKRPRGLWEGRRSAATQADSKSGCSSHDIDSDGCSGSQDGDAFDDDLDDDHSSNSSYKRRRLSSALSDSETLWHQSPSSRALTPDLLCHAPCFPTTIPSLKTPSYASSSSKYGKSMRSSPDKFSSINSRPKGKQPSASDLEDWENLKELFARATESYESDETAEALPLLRAIIRECHRFMLAHPDPSLVFIDSSPPPPFHSPAVTTPAEELSREWTPDCLEHALQNLTSHSHHHTYPHSHPQPPSFHPASDPSDPPTAFHAIFGTALFLMGTIIAQDANLALPDEPSTPSTYWLAALDVFETGENLPSVVEGTVEHSEDWRMAVSWGRTLVCLAEEKVEHSLRSQKPNVPKFPPQADLQNGWSLSSPTAGPFSLVEPRWPRNSPFHAIAAARPPVTRRMSLYAASAHDVMVLAMDQFSRGIFHMPHPHYSHSHNPMTIHLESPVVEGTGFSAAFQSRRHLFSLSPPPITVGLPFSRPKELFTIASEVLGIAERLSKAPQREYWAAQADSVFNQMQMEADMAEWRMALNAARGRCWLIIGEARAEEMEEALESGNASVLLTPEAEEARKGLAMAVTFLERAKGSATIKPNPEQEDLSPLLAEALLTLANLTADENAREELYSRAQAEGGDSIDLDLDPPPTAFPASISAIAEVAKRSSSIPALDMLSDGPHAPPPCYPVEASPSLIFASGPPRRSSTMVLDNALRLDQPMIVDNSRKDDQLIYMDES